MVQDLFLGLAGVYLTLDGGLHRAGDAAVVIGQNHAGAALTDHLAGHLAHGRWLISVDGQWTGHQDQHQEQG